MCRPKITLGQKKFFSFSFMNICLVEWEKKKKKKTRNCLYVLLYLKRVIYDSHYSFYEHFFYDFSDYMISMARHKNCLLFVFDLWVGRSGRVDGLKILWKYFRLLYMWFEIVQYLLNWKWNIVLVAGYFSPAYFCRFNGDNIHIMTNVAYLVIHKIYHQ